MIDITRDTILLIYPCLSHDRLHAFLTLVIDNIGMLKWQGGKLLWSCQQCICDHWLQPWYTNLRSALKLFLTRLAEEIVLSYAYQQCKLRPCLLFCTAQNAFPGVSWLKSSSLVLLIIISTYSVLIIITSFSSCVSMDKDLSFLGESIFGCHPAALCQ